MAMPVFRVEPIIMVVVERKQLLATERSTKERDYWTIVEKIACPAPVRFVWRLCPRIRVVRMVKKFSC